ncbi:hypothetical protein [Neobacillus terrae]|uniref:hypothetical protein n=1 Tax=Neobacillus terrae TaxID=3034837 RepID=UPI001408E13F|nr:hypothetical protein [Neobacillus terrae]NHM31859.1 hypothetical protein [Neobacillus terrae]
MIFAQEQINQNIVETCVEGFHANEKKEVISNEEAMQKVFNRLKEDGYIPNSVEDFSFQMPSCERLKKKELNEQDIPQKVILSYMYLFGAQQDCLRGINSEIIEKGAIRRQTSSFGIK